MLDRRLENGGYEHRGSWKSGKTTDKTTDNINTIVNQLSNKYNDVNIDNYLKSLSQQDLIVLQIAVTHLKTSFNLEKSIGYLNWLNANN